MTTEEQLKIAGTLKIFTDLKIAIYSGTTGSGEAVTEEEAHILSGQTKKELIFEALIVWGLYEHEISIHTY